LPRTEDKESKQEITAQHRHGDLTGKNDHFCVFFVSSLPAHKLPNRGCDTTENTSELFIQKLSSTPALSCISVNELVDGFNFKVIHFIAPTKVKVVSGKKRSPWRNATLVRKLSAAGKD